MSIAYPFEGSPIVWRTLFLGKWSFPGYIYDHNVDITWDFSVPKEKGKNSAKAVCQGQLPKIFNIVVCLSAKDDWLRFLPIAKDIGNLGLSGDEKPLPITFPEANMWGINQVKLMKVSTRYPDPRVGYLVALSLMEHREPTDTKSSDVPEKAASNTPANERVNMLDEAEAALPNTY